jgi:DNA-directed RNA polymerase specialized sigma24 family protein
VVFNVCASRWSRLSKRAADEREFVEAVYYDVPADYEPAPEDFQEVTGVIGDCLDMLARDDRQVLILRHVGGLSFEELAETLQVGLSAAKMRLYRAERRLKAGYEQAAGKPENG